MTDKTTKRTSEAPSIAVSKTGDEWTWRVQHRTGSVIGVAPTEDEAQAAAQDVADSITADDHGPA
jgi:hypothetical protein